MRRKNNTYKAFDAASQTQKYSTATHSIIHAVIERGSFPV